VVHQLFVDFKKADNSVRREVLCNILIEFGIPLKLVRLIKMFYVPYTVHHMTVNWRKITGKCTGIVYLS
jgi:hypothetical protein